MSSNKSWLKSTAEFIGEAAATISNEATRVYQDSTEAIAEALRAGTDAFEKHRQPTSQQVNGVSKSPDEKAQVELCTWQNCAVKAVEGYGLCKTHLDRFNQRDRAAWSHSESSASPRSCIRYTCNSAPVPGEAYCEAHLFEMHAFERTAALAKEQQDLAQAQYIATLCRWKNCTSKRLDSKDYCIAHQREYEQLKSRRCGMKFRHISLEDAHKEAGQMIAKTGDSFSAYHCNFCDHYHIGHTRPY